MPDKIEQLERLSSLYEKGLLTEEEFSAQKQEVLGSSGAVSVSVDENDPVKAKSVENPHETNTLSADLPVPAEDDVENFFKKRRKKNLTIALAAIVALIIGVLVWNESNKPKSGVITQDALEKHRTPEMKKILEEEERRNLELQQNGERLACLGGRWIEVKKVDGKWIKGKCVRR